MPLNIDIAKCVGMREQVPDSIHQQQSPGTISIVTSVNQNVQQFMHNGGIFPNFKNLLQVKALFLTISLYFVFLH